jgi:hypothetical protein
MQICLQIEAPKIYGDRLLNFLVTLFFQKTIIKYTSLELLKLEIVEPKMSMLLFDVPCMVMFFM